MNQCHFFVPIWRYPMTWPTQFSFRGFPPLLQQFGGFPSLLQQFETALGSAWFSDFRTHKDPKVFPATVQKGHLFITCGSTDTWLLQPEFQTAQQTKPLQITSLLSIFCWGTTHSCISAAVCSAGLSCSRQSSRINTTPGPTVAAAWGSNFFQLDLWHSIFWRWRTQRNSRFVVDHVHQQLQSEHFSRVLVCQGASPRRWGLLNAALGTAPAAPAGSAGSTGCNGRGSRGGHGVLRMNRKQFGQTWTRKMVWL